MIRVFVRDPAARERLAVGEAYSTGCADCGGEHLVVNELGHTYRSEWFSDEFRRMAKVTGLPVIRLQDARHTSIKLMILNHVPVPVSKWHGHASAAFTMTNYAHSQDDALAAAGALLGSVIRSSQSGV